MLERFGRLLARVFGRSETHRHRAELVELARQATIYPDNERLVLRLADGHLRAGDEERALSGYWHVVDIYKKRSDWQKTAAVLKRIILLAPGELIARFETAHAYEKLERWREAAQQWEQAGRIHKAHGEVDGAVRCFTRALALDPLQQQLAHEISRLRPPPRIVPIPQQTPVRPNLASLGRAQVVEELAHPYETMSDDPAALLAELELGAGAGSDTTTEYSAEELGTLLDTGFNADTIAVESMPPFDEEHRPGETPVDPIFLSR